jgi:hypothetical protein
MVKRDIERFGRLSLQPGTTNIEALISGSRSCLESMLPDECRLSLHRPSDWGAKAHSNAAVALAGMSCQRFVAAFMHFGKHSLVDNRHWAFAFFDRISAVLCVFDTWESGRQRRLQAAGAYWSKFWHTLGYPYAFQAINNRLHVG